MRIGTNHFLNSFEARQYYRPYGYDAQDVQEMIDDGTICLGRPELEEGDILILDRDGRYHIDKRD